jgi:hypothetical protein
LVTGLTFLSKEKPDPVCKPCLSGKMHANPFPSSDTRATRPLELVHTDVHGPLPVQTHSGYCHWCLFVDVYLLKKKSGAFPASKDFKAWAENATGHKMSALRDDKGGEYISKKMDLWCSEHGIKQQHSVRNCPQQNGVAERANRTMLNHSGLPPSNFWLHFLCPHSKGQKAYLPLSSHGEMHLYWLPRQLLKAGNSTIQ